MFNYKKFSLPKIFTIFLSYSTNKTESPCTNSRYSQCLNCFSYLLPAVLCDCRLKTSPERSSQSMVHLEYRSHFSSLVPMNCHLVAPHLPGSQPSPTRGRKDTRPGTKAVRKSYLNGSISRHQRSNNLVFWSLRSWVFKNI